MNDVNYPFSPAKPISSSRDTLMESSYGGVLRDRDFNSANEHGEFAKSFGYEKVFTLSDETTSPQLSMKPSPGQTVPVDAQSPLEKRSITIADEEFDDPPAKMKKLALAIKIFCKSFKEMKLVNNPETDRSARVESIRSKVFAVVSTVTRILSPILPWVLYFGALLGISVVFALLAEICLYSLILLPVYVFSSCLVAIPIFEMCSKLLTGIEHVITAAVAAAVDTREKLTEMTACPRQVRFLQKYQRMEESLLALQTKRYAAELAKIDGDPHSCPELKAKLRASLEPDRVKAGIANLDNDKWYVAYQRKCLRNRYRGDIKHLDEAISKTEDWLNRAANQKHLLLQAQQELNNQYATKKTVDRPMDEKLENPAHYMPV